MKIGDGLGIMFLQWLNIRPQTVVVNSVTRRAGNPCGGCRWPRKAAVVPAAAGDFVVASVTTRQRAGNSCGGSPRGGKAAKVPRIDARERVTLNIVGYAIAVAV
jgi:hypothetical protein